MRYMVVIDKTPRNYGAFSPDMPGCIATGATAEEVTSLMHEGIGYALEDLVERGEPLPEPTSWAIEVKGYAVPISRTPNGYCAEPPDLFPVVAAADTRKRVEALIRGRSRTTSHGTASVLPKPPRRSSTSTSEVPQPVSA